MFKLLLSTLLILFSSSLFAQSLTPDEKQVFDEIVYKRRQVGEYAVISKWATPIRYKVYGDIESWLMKEIDSTFNQVKRLTKLDISKTISDDEANFIFVIGKKEIGKLSQNMEKYLDSYGGTQYKTNKNLEVSRVENFVNADKYRFKTDVRYVVKKHIIKSFGFFQTTMSAPSSLFYAQNNNKLKIDTFDSHIISTLYLPAIKSGMSKDEVDQVLKEIK